MRHQLLQGLSFLCALHLIGWFILEMYAATLTNGASTDWSIDQEFQFIVNVLEIVISLTVAWYLQSNEEIVHFGVVITWLMMMNWLMLSMPFVQNAMPSNSLCHYYTYSSDTVCNVQTANVAMAIVTLVELFCFFLFFLYSSFGGKGISFNGALESAAAITTAFGIVGFSIFSFSLTTISRAEDNSELNALAVDSFYLHDALYMSFTLGVSSFQILTRGSTPIIGMGASFIAVILTVPLFIVVVVKGNLNNTQKAELIGIGILSFSEVLAMIAFFGLVRKDPSPSSSPPPDRRSSRYTEEENLEVGRE